MTVIGGSRAVQTPSPRYGEYSQDTQSPSGRSSAHNCGFGYGAVTEQGHRRYSGAQRDPSRPATPGSSYANVFEVSFHAGGRYLFSLRTTCVIRRLLSAHRPS
jgi:hypothetical protein